MSEIKFTNVEIHNKYAEASHWDQYADRIPAKGDFITFEVTSTNGEKIILLKQGDGSTSLGDLPFLSALSADVYDWAKAELPDSEVSSTSTNPIQNKAVKAYVDTIETKITNSKVGQKKPEGGEIFNDYEHNKTFGEGTSARGLNTQAGTLARKIVANGITSSADSDIMYLITVSGLVNSDELCTDAWVATDSYIEGTSDLVTVDCSTHLSNAFYISKIEENSETNTTVITIKKVDDRVVPILTMDDITGTNREEDWIYVPGKLNGEISPQFTSAFAGGKNSVATGFAAMSFGRDNMSAGNYSVTLGRGNKASYGGLAAGVYNEAGNYGTALGNSNKALGDNSVATGVGTYARAASSRAGGRYSRAESEYSVAEGLHVVTHARTPAQVVFGRYNRADNNSLFIIGNGASDTQRANVFEVRKNGSVWVLDGTERLATISDVNTKPGRIGPNNGTLLSIYQGYTTALGNYSLASGYSKATAPYSTALGWGTASEQYAFSTGYDTNSSGFASASFGYKTKADSHSQFVVGQYNKSVSNALFIVGNGSDGSRSNAFEVYNDGHAEVQTQGTTDNSVVNKKYINDNILDYISLSYAAGPSGNQETTSITADNSSIITLLNKDGIGIGISKGTLAYIGPSNATLVGFNIDNSPIASEKYVSNSIAAQVSSVYKAKGSIANVSALAAPSKAYEGFVYNIETEFTTTANFVEGAGKKFPAGTNVVCVNTTGTTYKWDVLAGMIDLTNYATKSDLSGKQATLVSGTNIKTINNKSILGSGNISIPTVTVDNTLSSTSTNPVQNKVINAALSGKASSTHTHTLNQVTPSTFNTSGSVDYISRSLIPYISGTKFYGMPATAITVEYSRDGGTTWIDYGLDNGAKMRIFDHSGGANLYLGKASTKADNNINNMLRITIDATKSDGRYLSTDSMFTWMTTNGNTTYVTLEVASYSAPTKFNKIVDNAPLNGWSGPNMSHYGSITFGGSTAGSTSPNNQFYRLTYKQTAINSNYPSAQIADVRFFGLHFWAGGNYIVTNMLKQGTPYSVRINPDNMSGAVNFSLLGAAFGVETYANGKYSLSGGKSNTVSSDYAIAYGTGLGTALANQAVFGKYNAISSTALFQVGNGTTSSRKTAFNVFTDGHAEVQTQGTTDNSVVIKKTLDAKQDKFATVTTANTVQTVKIGDNLSIITSPNFGYSQISSTKILSLSSGNSTTSYIQLGKTKLGNSHDFDATQGYLRVRDNPLADDFAVNKKYVTTAVSNKLDADTDNYNIAYDTTSESIKITFKN